MGWIAAATAGIVALSAALIKATEHQAKLSETMSATREKGDDTRSVDDKKFDLLQQLATKQKLSNAEQRQAAKIVGELTGRYGDFGATIDGVTGSLSLAADSMERFIAGVNASALRDLNAELAQSQANLAELTKAEESNMGAWNNYLRRAGSNITGFYVKTAEERVAAIGDQKAAESKKIAAIQGGENATDVAKPADQAILYQLTEGGKTPAQVAADNAEKLAKINDTISRERKTKSKMKSTTFVH